MSPKQKRHNSHFRICAIPMSRCWCCMRVPPQTASPVALGTDTSRDAGCPGSPPDGGIWRHIANANHANTRRSPVHETTGTEQTDVKPTTATTWCGSEEEWVTRSSSSVNFWSQAWLLTGLQLVCPTTVLSSFNTALISSEDTHSGS